MTAGIVAEYDPFHRGHQYQLIKARELTGADSIIVVLGGDFLQRGWPSLTGKRARARMAVEGGADLVLALPYIYSVNSAREYARGAAGILDNIGCVEFLSFGSESADSCLLKKAASVMNREEALAPVLKEYLAAGISYPEAMTRAVARLGGAETAELLRRPNDLLACEDIRALGENGSAITPVPVRRLRKSSKSSEKNDYPVVYPSASEIRSMMTGQGMDAAAPMVPDTTVAVFRESYDQTDWGSVRRRMSGALFQLLRYRILTADPSELRRIYMVEEGLEYRLKAAVSDESVDSAAALVEAVVTKRYTKARISRMLTHLLMNITKEEFHQLKGTYCARVLAFNDRGRQLLARMKKTSEIPVISNLSGWKRYGGKIRRILELEIRAAGMYEMLQGGSDPAGGEIRYVPYYKRG